MLNVYLLNSIAASLLVHNAQLTLLQNLRSTVKLRLPIRGNATRGTRQNFFAPCLFHFTVHRSRENLRNPFTFTYIIILVALSRVALPRIGKHAFKPFSTEEFGCGATANLLQHHSPRVRREVA